MFVHPGASPREEDAERQASCGRRALAGSARYCQPAAGAPRGRGDIGSGTFRIYSSRDYGGGGRDGERGGTVGSDSDISERGGGGRGDVEDTPMQNMSILSSSKLLLSAQVLRDLFLV